MATAASDAGSLLSSSAASRCSRSCSTRSASILSASILSASSRSVSAAARGVGLPLGAFGLGCRLGIGHPSAFGRGRRIGRLCLAPSPLPLDLLCLGLALGLGDISTLLLGDRRSRRDHGIVWRGPVLTRDLRVARRP